MKKKIQIFKKKSVHYPLIVIGLLLLVVISNLYLQWCQNELSTDLMLKFAFSWHTEKFILGCLVLLVFLLFLISLAGSFLLGSVLYAITIAILGFADYQKMFYRTEPIYPDDLKMITEFGLLREMIGTVPFIVIVLIAAIALVFFCRAIYKSRLLSKKMQIVRVTGLIVTIGLLVYISDFNNPNNLLRKQYDKTALWIPYSQKMNYYNTGFIGGFLFNLKVEAMDEPDNYSKKTITEITEKYNKQVTAIKDAEEEQPNIIFVMSESFSDPQHLAGVTANKNPLKDYYEVADKTYSGQMLSQNYGGGTANIEFEALTSFSMELFNPQMTTPYTMLVPKMDEVPSIVSLLKNQDYRATAIHPYNTSMYKRKDVYNVLGFDQFISEDTMKYKEKLQNNPYISDQSAYKEVLDLLKDDQQPQFVHLVTMQTHMPYSDKYTNIEYSSQGQGNKTAIDSYMQDIAYSSAALKEFTEELKNVKRRTLVVFWGDHLPSIYSDEIKEMNDEVMMHQTEFLMYDTQGSLREQKTQDAISSLFYFAPTLFDQSNLQMTGFYQLLSQLEKQVPAFEKSFYYTNGNWNKTLKLNKEQEELYEDYRMIQYDIVSGEQYSLKKDFFD
ncbi:LTA synthase family protein [Enterococcus wangshanyuanii]|uniref:Membrane protein n=1 Tax=Enterococcus wangshanyuanii TaxID=2005703 RepID=A0ABQ1NI10_9ENTE|nr:LTA synthase family protein [Enterococcus wangshanyuanii]GGC77657.1 membrane protein [Enterococcus wangshanyuanii]